MDEEPDERSSLAVAYGLASRVTTISLMTAVPAIAGDWADSRWEKSWFLPLGLVAGFVFGTYQLVRLAKDMEDDDGKNC
jgi:hypothetical protein